MFWFYDINMIILVIFEFKEIIKTEAFDNFFLFLSEIFWFYIYLRALF